MFSPLKEGGAQRIFYQGKFYDLDERHKVVFACNPAKYGGGRFEQKLFDDGKIPAMHLRDFPAAYIYEKILKDSIYEGLGDAVKDKIDEEKFKGICQPLILKYQETNSRKKSDKDANEETVRELQEKVLQQVADDLKEKKEPETKSTANFISTNATKEVEEALTSSLQVREKQRQGFFPNKAIGLNGVLLEGDSGTGKSELIGAVLAFCGILEKKFFAQEESVSAAVAATLPSPPPPKQQFYKIDASLPLDQKKKIIVKAFEEGNIVWIDEINSCIDDGLEKVLNAALTGDHPEGKKGSVTPGFMLISSVNSAGLEGRSIISPALKHRTIQPRVKKLREYSAVDLTKIVKHWLDLEKEDSEISAKDTIREAVCANIAKDFLAYLKSEGGENLNLRMLRSKLKDILPKYVELANSVEAIEKPVDLQLLVSTLTQEETKESISRKLASQGIQTSDIERIELGKVLFEEVDRNVTLTAPEVAKRKTKGILKKDLTEDNLNYASKAVVAKAIKIEDRSVISAADWSAKTNKEIWYKRFNKKNCSGIDLNKAFMTTFTKCHFDKSCELPKNLKQLDPRYFLECTFDEEIWEKNTEFASKIGLKKRGDVYATKAFKDLDLPREATEPRAVFRIAEIAKGR